MVLGKKEVSETEIRAQQHYKEGMKKTRGNLLKQLQSVFQAIMTLMKRCLKS